MKIRNLLFFGSLAVIALLLILQARVVHYGMATNKAQYLMNQRKWDDARGVLTYVESFDPGNFRALKLLAQVEMNTGGFREAERILGKVPESAEVLFDRGICLYELDQEARAGALFAGAAQPGTGELPAPLRQLSETAAVEFRAGEARDLLPELPGSVSPVHRMFWNSVMARIIDRRGRFADARARAEEALRMGDRNMRTRLLACAMNAVDGNFARAQMFADYRRGNPGFYEELGRELAESLDLWTTKSVSRKVADITAERRHNLRRALGWAFARQGVETSSPERASLALDTVDAVLAESPRDLDAALLKGDILEMTGDLGGAYRQWQSILGWQVSYPALSRIGSLLGGDPDSAGARESFRGFAGIVAWINAEDILTTGGIHRPGQVTCLQQAVCAARFDAPAAGEYHVNIVARGDRAFGLSPLASVRLDGAPAGEIYVAMESWDCYSLPMSLNVGSHTLEIEYLNNSERLPSGDEDRNLFLHCIIITRIGVR